MKSILKLLLILFLFINCSKDENEKENLTYIPDDNFEKRLIEFGYDDVLDNYVITENIIKITRLTLTMDGRVNEDPIKDLTGIEDFINLYDLHVGPNQLKILDLSKNTLLEHLNCYSNQLTSLDLSKNTLLKVFSCNNNQLTSLDLSKNTLLEVFSCDNNQLTSLDLSKNTLLKQFSCENNQLTSLDVSMITDLSFFRCRNNPLTCIKVSSSQINNILWGWTKDSSQTYSLSCP